MGLSGKFSIKIFLISLSLVFFFFNIKILKTLLILYTCQWLHLFGLSLQNGKASLGDMIYRMITLDMFDVEKFLLEMDLSSEHKILDLQDKIEASVVIWKRKIVQKDNNKSSSPFSTNLSMEKRQLLEERAETILLLIKLRFPGISQSTLDISKIQFNKVINQNTCTKITF